MFLPINLLLIVKQVWILHKDLMSEALIILITVSFDSFSSSGTSNFFLSDPDHNFVNRHLCS